MHTKFGVRQVTKTLPLFRGSKTKCREPSSTHLNYVIQQDIPLPSVSEVIYQFSTINERLSSHPKVLAKQLNVRDRNIISFSPIEVILYMFNYIVISTTRRER